jgi:hypothetical protein
MPEDDLSIYKSKETLISHARDKRLERERLQREQTDGRTPNLGEYVRRAISDDEIDDRGVEESGRQSSSAVHGTNGSTQDGAGGSYRYGDIIGTEFVEPTGSDSSTYQPVQPKRKRNTVRGVYEQYKEALRGDRGTGQKEEKKKATGAKLTDSEVIRLRPKMVELVLWQTEHMDQFIIATTRGHNPNIIIWSDMTPEEAEIIVDYLMSRGKVDARFAVAVRQAAQFMDRLRLALIIMPRMYATFMTYMQNGISIR